MKPRRHSRMTGSGFMRSPDAGGDQGLVADESEGQADQDRREGGEPRPLCYLPDGRGRHCTANVPGDFAADRGATAAATTSASVRRSMSCIQEQPTEGVRPYIRENRQMRPSNAVRTVWDAEAIDTSHISFRPSRKLLPSTPVWGSFGESRVKAGAVPLGVQVEVVNVRTEIDICASSNVI